MKTKSCYYWALASIELILDLFTEGEDRIHDNVWCEGKLLEGWLEWGVGENHVLDEGTLFENTLAVQPFKSHIKFLNFTPFERVSF